MTPSEKKEKIPVPSSINFTNNVMMVRPACFGYNEETALDNAFQTQISGMTSQEISEKAVQEFELLANKLQENNINVELIEDTKKTESPDAVFPNNWISFHEPHFVITYPMLSKKRRTERRDSIIEVIKQKYEVKDRYNYEKFEAEEKYLEGTGSMIFDRVNKIIYACRSVRTDEDLFRQFCKELGFLSVLFDAKDKDEKSIYHTNVMLCIGNDFVVICLDAVRDKADRMMLKKSFEISGKEVIEISLDQMCQYAGNMIQLTNNEGDFFLIMSSSAYNSLDDSQLTRLKAKTNIIHSDLSTIETLGGGSARCMIAEIFLNKK